MKDFERPVGLNNVAPGWGSDAFALAMRNTGIEYVALNPGASYRGLHDSLVNFLGNTAPQMLLCLHEEHAVAIAHGYAKVTGKPMGVVMHSNVGLMHGSMAIFNAWCDRMPVMLFGATGPVDAAKRRPWIDWIHTAKDQGALIRNFIKWDDQPASVAAAFESVYRAAILAQTPPYGPVYICFDTAMQETPLPEGTALPDAARFRAPEPPEPGRAAVEDAAKLLAQAKRPVVLAGRVSRNPEAWQRRLELIEMLGALVITDMKAGAAFPTDHPLHVVPPVYFLSPAAIEIVREADVVLSLDWIDLAGTLKGVWGDKPVAAKVVQASLELYATNSWSMDHQGLPPVDVALLSDPDTAVAALLPKVKALAPAARPWPAPRAPLAKPEAEADGIITLPALAEALKPLLHGQDVTMVRLPLGWATDRWDFHAPLDHLGYDGGGGVGSGPGMVIGAALALKGSDRLVIGIIGDGDYLMGINALWTAAHYRIPVLFLLANNHSFFNDELHQDRVARERGRPPENRWIGQRVEDPLPDLAKLAEGQGVKGIGPVTSMEGLEAALKAGIAEVKAGRPCVVDIHVLPKYESTMAAAMVRKGSES